MREIIIDKLNEIELKHDVKILYAIESGSRGWGFESEDSDYDVRFIYIHKPEWYLSIENRRDVIELPIDNLLDINGWDIRKTLNLFKKSNPALLEWMNSPINYKQETDFINHLRELANDYFSSKSCIYHYLHMATGNYREYLKKDLVKIKKYFYVLRPLMACMWIEKNQNQPPMIFEELMNSLDIEQEVIEEINNLLERKKASKEMKEEAKIEVLNNFIAEKIDYYTDYVKSISKNDNNGYAKLNKLFRETLNTTWEAYV